MWTPTLVWFVIFCGLISFSSAVGWKKRKGANDAVMHVEVAEVDPADRSIKDWASLTHEDLVLACDQAHLLATGSSRVLVDRLVAFYHPPQHPATTTTTVVPPATRRRVSSVNVSPHHHGLQAPAVTSTYFGGVGDPIVNFNINNTTNSSNISSSAGDIAHIISLEIQRQLANHHQQAPVAHPQAPVVVSLPSGPNIGSNGHW